MQIAAPGPWCVAAPVPRLFPSPILKASDLVCQYFLIEHCSSRNGCDNDREAVLEV